MADQTITGNLYVTEKVSIGQENAIAQLHISSPTTPSRVFLESSGALLKLAVDATGATIGTDNAFGVNLQTDGSSRLAISKTGDITISTPLTVQNALIVNGNVGIGTPTPTTKLEVSGIIKATSFQGNGATLDGIVKKAGDTITGSLTIQDNLTVNGNLNSQGRLEVKADIRAGNSDIYFTKTDHNHTGFGNTTGFAGIENAANYEALMILGRAGTAKGRSVKLWDYLQVNGDLEVTGNILGRVAGIGIALAVLEDGQSLPIPTGFTQQECVFFVFPKSVSFNAGEAVQFSCWVNEGKVVASPKGKVYVTGVAIAKKGGW